MSKNCGYCKADNVTRPATMYIDKEPVCDEHAESELGYRVSRTDLCETCKWEDHPCCAGEADCPCCGYTIAHQHGLC